MIKTEVGKNGPTVTHDMIEERIEKVAYHFIPDTTLTICVITLENGFTVTGESACADPANFSEELGKEYSYRDAFNQIWPLEGYLLKQRMYEREFNSENA